jgi:flagellar biosynthetic protein FliR
MILEAMLPEVAVFLLEATRISGVIIAAPLAWSSAPAQARVGLTLALAMAIHGATPPALHVNDIVAVVSAVPVELLVGLSMGLVVRFALAAVQVATDVFSPMLGFGVASLFDPHEQVTETPLTQLLRQLAILFALILGLHRVALGALLQSFRLVPIGAVLRPGAATEGLLDASSAALLAGTRLAMPIVAVLLVTQVALAFVSRAAPAMQIFSVGFAVTLLCGGTVLVLALPDMGTAIVEELSHVGPRIERVLVDFAEG